MCLGCLRDILNVLRLFAWHIKGETWSRRSCFKSENNFFALLPLQDDDKGDDYIECGKNGEGCRNKAKIEERLQLLLMEQKTGYDTNSMSIV
jgi:hypothetical protein